MADSSAFGSVHAGALSVSAVEAEQRHLATVVREIDARLERVGRERRGHAEALVEMRREFWQDMKLQAEAIDAAALARPFERSLRLMSWGMTGLAVGLVLARAFG